MSIEWQKEMNSGVPALDFQHQKIFETIGDIFRQCEAGASLEELEYIFASLDLYAQKHFSYEENLQQKSNYPELKSQQDHHQLFFKELEELKNMLKGEESSLKEVAMASKGKLIRWWILHIKNMDRKFIEFLKEREG
jgi:hemerythrin